MTAADLAPPRYQLPLDLLMGALAIVMLAAIVLDWPASAWRGLVEKLLFATIGLNWFVWPNSRSFNPSAARIAGGIMLALSLLAFVQTPSFHLI